MKDKKVIDLVNVSRYNSCGGSRPSYVIAIFEDDSAEVVYKYNGLEKKVYTGPILLHLDKYNTVERIRNYLLNSKLIHDQNHK